MLLFLLKVLIPQNSDPSVCVVAPSQILTEYFTLPICGLTVNFFICFVFGYFDTKMLFFQRQRTKQKNNNTNIPVSQSAIVGFEFFIKNILFFFTSFFTCIDVKSNILSCFWDIQVRIFYRIIQLLRLFCESKYPDFLFF